MISPTTASQLSEVIPLGTTTREGADISLEEMGRPHKPTLPPVPDRCGPPTVSLALLLDFAIQHAFHDITVLSELLPKKKENDRKTSVVQFAYSTRMIFVKLQAIVKWIKMSKKFEPLTSICHFLDQQSLMFVDTADGLVNIARRELQLARVPNFQVVQAVDVLTLGTYARLPQDIKDRLSGERTLSKQEQACTLHRLNRIVEYHLAAVSGTLSPLISSIVIRNGMAVVTVPGEFEMTLTILGSSNLPPRWYLLNLAILVESHTRVGDGQKLVHPRQLNFLHQIVQDKLDNGTQPLHDAHCILHSFCRGLQLAVLYGEAMELRARISPTYLRVEQYDPAKGILAVGYWLPTERTKPNLRRLPAAASHPYRIVISTDVDDPHGTLQTVHYPPISPTVDRLLPSLLSNGERLSLSDLLAGTILRRCQEKLLSIETVLRGMKLLEKVEFRSEDATMLRYYLAPYLAGEDCPAEALTIGINSFYSRIICKLQSIGDCPELRELEHKLGNGNITSERAGIEKLLARLRLLVLQERFKSPGLQVKLVPAGQLPPIISKMKELPPEHICFQFTREEQFYLIVAFTADEQGEMDVELYLFSIQADSSMMRFSLEETLRYAPALISRKPSSEGNMPKPSSLDQRLRSAVANLEDRLLFLRISEELDKRRIVYEHLECEPLVGGHALRLIDITPAMPSTPPREFFDKLSGCYLRMDLRQSIPNFSLECTMVECPLGDCNATAGTSRTWIQPVLANPAASFFTIGEAITYNVVERLTIYCHVYEPVKRFAAVYDEYFREFCTVEAFTYHKIVLSYGRDRSQLMLLSWKPRAPRSKAQFTVNFGMKPGVAQAERSWNPHVLVAAHLTEKFNRSRDLVELVNYLLNTYESLALLYNFARVLLHSTKTISQLLSIEASFPVEVQSHLVAVSEREVRLVYGVVHLEFLLLNDNFVGVRDTTTPVGLLPSADSPFSLTSFWLRLGATCPPAPAAENPDASYPCSEDSSPRKT